MAPWLAKFGHPACLAKPVASGGPHVAPPTPISPLSLTSLVRRAGTDEQSSDERRPPRQDAGPRSGGLSQDVAASVPAPRSCRPLPPAPLPPAPPSSPSRSRCSLGRSVAAFAPGRPHPALPPQLSALRRPREGRCGEVDRGRRVGARFAEDAAAEASGRRRRKEEGRVPASPRRSRRPSLAVARLRLLQPPPLLAAVATAASCLRSQQPTGAAPPPLAAAATAAVRRPAASARCSPLPPPPLIAPPSAVVASESVGRRSAVVWVGKIGVEEEEEG